jgi:serine O-acetyltransferase
MIRQIGPVHVIAPYKTLALNSKLTEPACSWFAHRVMVSGRMQMSANGSNNIVRKAAEALARQHRAYADAPTITMAEAGSFLDLALGIIFPQLSGGGYRDADALEASLKALGENLEDLLERATEDSKTACSECTDRFLAELPNIGEAVLKDAEAGLAGDPAAHSISEIIITYPGFYAIAAHRIAHHFYAKDVPLFPRLLGEFSHRLTGIDIHPGAQIGEGFFLDHATAVVIGETAIIGNNVKIYQGVTLGALKVDKGQRNVKRHPTIEDDVVIYANATILGGETVVGNNSIIGGNVWLTKSVLPHSRIMYKAADSAENALNWSI